MEPSLSHDYYRIEKAIDYLEKNFQAQPSLEELAESVQVSPFHFQRMFTSWVGISPKRFLQYLTIDFLKAKIQESENLLEAAMLSGLSSPSRVHDLFTTLEGVTPQEYKMAGRGMVISYGFHDTPFGRCLIGITQRGVCWLSFVVEGKDPLHEMREYWAYSDLVEDSLKTKEVSEAVFNRFVHPENQWGKLNVLVKGTNFQVKVWEALLNIPWGQVVTYQTIARATGHPKALQAVGSAIGANPIAWLIPCHRVIRKDGIPGQYRWNSTRKKSLIAWEMAKDGKEMDKG